MLKVSTVDAQHLVFLSGKSFFLWEDGGQGATEGKKNRLILQGRTAIIPSLTVIFGKTSQKGLFYIAFPAVLFRFTI